VDLEAVEIAHDQQRLVFEVFAVEQKLTVGGREVFVLALVFPAEVAAHPNVGPTLAAARLAHAALERVPGAFRVGGGGLGLGEQIAEVEKMLLAGAAFGEIDQPPFGDEILGCHARVPASWVCLR
jgi:hypothetical protein